MSNIALFRQRVNQLKKAEADLKHAMQKLENAPSLNGCPWHVGQTIKSTESGDLIIERIIVMKQPDTYTLSGWQHGDGYYLIAYYRNTRTKQRGTLSERI